MHKYLETKLDIDFYRFFFFLNFMPHIVSANGRFPFLFHWYMSLITSLLIFQICLSFHLI